MDYLRMYTALTFIFLHSPMRADLLHQSTKENIDAAKTYVLILSDSYMHSTENSHWKSGLSALSGTRLLIIWGSILQNTSKTKLQTFSPPQPPKLRHQLLKKNVLKVCFSELWLK